MGITLGWGGIGIWSALVISPAISTVILSGRFYWVISDKIAHNQEMEDRSTEETQVFIS